MKGFWALQLSISNKQERESEQIINLLLSEETTNFKSWDQQIHNKLHEIHSLVGKIPCSYGPNQKEQVVLTRCPIY
jgi:hypothetical protein